MADEPKPNEEEVVTPAPVEPEVPEPETPEPEAPEEVSPPENPEEEPVVPEEEADPELSRRAKKRAGQLKFNELLNRRPETPPAPSQSKRENALNYGEDLDAPPEIVKQLEDDRRAAELAQYQAGLNQSNTLQWNTRLEIDAPQVESKYKFLDMTDKENFDPVRANAMNQLYFNHVGYRPGDPEKGIPESVANPYVRYKDFVEAQMEFAEALMADSKVQSSKNIGKQAAQTGLRPDGSSAKRLNLDRDPSEMTMEELYASIGQKPPK